MRSLLMGALICYSEYMKNNLILVGMPGSGKSTCGVLAAKALCKSFIDTDLLIQAEEGTSLQTIINSKGNDYFAKVEEKVLSNLQAENSIISTGGSAIYYEEALNHLKENGMIVYLRVSYNQMMKRIKNMRSRGILLKNGQTIKDMFMARECLYELNADCVIDCRGKSIEDVVECITAVWMENFGAD